LGGNGRALERIRLATQPPITPIKVWKKKMTPKEVARSSGRVTFPMKLIHTGMKSPMKAHDPPQRTRNTPMSSASLWRLPKANHAPSSTQGMPDSAWKTKTACFRSGRWLVKCDPNAPGR